MGQRDALGQAGRAARVEELGQGVLVDRRAGAGSGEPPASSASYSSLASAAGLALHDHEARPLGSCGAIASTSGVKSRWKKTTFEPAWLEDVGDLVGREPDVDRVEDRPGLEHAVVGLEQVVGVVGDEARPDRPADAELDERVRQPVRPLAELRGR